MLTTNTRKALLVCGIASAAVYAAADLLAAVLYPEYHSFISQSVSELSAIGAPSRAIVLPFLITYSVLVIPFGVGVWRSAGRTRPLRVVGVLLVGLGIIDVMAPLFPMHMRGTEATLTDAMHITFTIVTVAVILLAIGFGATAFGKMFHIYSIAMIAALVLFGALGGLDGPRIAAHLPTPWLGVTERINIGGYLLWQVVLAVSLLRVRHSAMITRRADATAA